MARQKTYSVTIVTNAAGTSERDHLSGVFGWANTGKPWRIRLLNGTDELEREIDGNRPDGVISMLPEDRVLSKLLAARIPCVFTDYPPRTRRGMHSGVSFVHVDDEAVGRAAAGHFLSRGRFNDFAFALDETQFRYACERERGFAAALAEKGIGVRRIALPPGGATGSETESAVAWFSGLSRPFAVFAARDRAALKVANLLAAARIAVPEMAGVLGVDNDEVVCNAASPELSSIHPDHRGLGAVAARELERLMRGGRGRTIVAGTAPEVVMRASTRIVPPAAHLISSALSFIRSRVPGNPSVADVVAHLGCSRRLADLRFRQMHGASIGETIRDARLDFVKRRLVSTSDSVGSIAAECGFSSSAVLARFFRSRSGVSMREWRAAHRA